MSSPESDEIWENFPTPEERMEAKEVVKTVITFLRERGHGDATQVYGFASSRISFVEVYYRTDLDVIDPVTSFLKDCKVRFGWTGITVTFHEFSGGNPIHHKPPNAMKMSVVTV